MRIKCNERALAIAMRKKGESVPYIARTLSVSKSSVSLWLRGTTLPPTAIRILKAKRVQGRKLANAAKKRITADRLKKAEHEAHTIVSENIITPQLALIGCSLMYWCEGSKSKNDAEFTFTNSDPTTVQGFLSLLRRAIPIDEKRLRVKMHLHAYHNESVQRRFWSKVTRIPTEQFQNTFWKTNSGQNIKLGYPGCVHIRYHDVSVSRKISAVARNFLTSINVLK